MSFGMINATGNKNVTAQQDADLYSGIVGDKVILPVGEQMRLEVVNNNTMRIYDGEMIWQGRRFHIDANTYEDFTIDNGEQGKVRYDLIGFRYYKENGKEMIEKYVRKDTGKALPGEPGIIRDGVTSTFFPVYQIRINGLSVESSIQIPNSMKSISQLMSGQDSIASKLTDLVDIQCGKETCDFSTTLKSKTVKFPRKMRGGSTPAIIITIGGGSAWAKGAHANASTTNNDGFDLNFVCDSGSGSVSISWAAFGRA